MDPAEELRQKYIHCPIKPDQVAGLWEAEDPIDLCQDFLLEFLQDQSEAAGRNLNAYSEYEDRYEKNQELKFLAGYIVDVLVVLKHTLKLEDDCLIADILDLFWRVLDLNDKSSKASDGSAVKNRTQTLMDGLS